LAAKVFRSRQVGLDQFERFPFFVCKPSKYDFNDDLTESNTTPCFFFIESFLCLFSGDFCVQIEKHLQRSLTFDKKTICFVADALLGAERCRFVEPFVHKSRTKISWPKYIQTDLRDGFTNATMTTLGRAKLVPALIKVRQQLVEMGKGTSAQEFIHQVLFYFETPRVAQLLECL